MKRRNLLKGLLASPLVTLPSFVQAVVDTPEAKPITVPGNASGHAKYWNYKVDLLDFSEQGPERQLEFLNTLNGIYARAMTNTGWTVTQAEVYRVRKDLTLPDSPEFCLYVRGQATMSSEDCKARQAADFFKARAADPDRACYEGADLKMLQEWLDAGQHPTCSEGFMHANYPKSLILHNYYLNQVLKHDYLERDLVVSDMNSFHHGVVTAADVKDPMLRAAGYPV